MHRWRHALIALGVLTLVGGAIPASATHATFPHTSNMQALGHAEHIAAFPGAVSSDIAFWGDHAFQGNFDGFRIIDISDSANPSLVNHTSCNGDQGDIVVWEDILVRSWNSRNSTDRLCDGTTVPALWEGVHVFDISNLNNPQLVASVELPCGSHTATLVPDLANERVIVYSNVSSGSGPNAAQCNAMDVIEVPLAGNGAGAHLLRQEPITGGTLGSNNGCHDAGAILGRANLLVCASGHAANVFSIGAPNGGTLVDPLYLYSIEESEVHDGVTIQVGAAAPPGQDQHHGGRWHSAGFSWDGKVIILGWEPGGGLQAECTEHDADITKAAYFYDARTGAKLGRWVLPRNQGEDENCTVHNYNVVPTRTGRDILISGNYQAGTWVTEFTDPANPKTLGWVDPPSLGPGPFCDPDGAGGPMPPTCQLGGAWSSYWYNGIIYESDITRGLALYRFTGKQVRRAVSVDHLNPQTQEFTL